MKREFIIDGARFNDIEGFYCEIDNLFTKDLDWKTGHNLSAFHDILCGGMGVHKYGEPIKIIWTNFKKSVSDFGYEAAINYWETSLNECHPTNVPYVQKRIEDAKNMVGETLMDIIVGIILNKDNLDNPGHNCELVTID